MGAVDFWLAHAPEWRQATGRPLVSLCYAQSLDGCLTAIRGQPLGLSGPESLRLTHQLRAAHAAILVGVGTVLADDPSLTVRLADGPHPQPVVLDSHLRFPLGAKLLQHPHHAPWIVTTPNVDRRRFADLQAAGARLMVMPSDEHGRPSLPALLQCIASEGVQRLMVEGGARVITSFLTQALADLAVITLAPVFLGGLAVMDGPLAEGAFPRLQDVITARLGEDIILAGRLGEFAQFALHKVAAG